MRFQCVYQPVVAGLGSLCEAAVLAEGHGGQDDQERVLEHGLRVRVAAELVGRAKVRDNFNWYKDKGVLRDIEPTKV